MQKMKEWHREKKNWGWRKECRKLNCVQRKKKKEFRKGKRNENNWHIKNKSINKQKMQKIKELMKK